MKIIIVSAVIVFLLFSISVKAEVENVYYWRSVYYENTPLEDDAYIGMYEYNIPENNDVIGLSLHAESGLMIVGMGRLRPGIPSSLNAFCVSDYSTGQSPHLWGFPNYDMNTLQASFYEDSSRKRIAKRQATYSAGYYKHFFNNYRHAVYDKTNKAKPSDQTIFGNDNFNIISVVHPEVDNQCNRLFVVDSGVLQYSATEIYEVQNPALIVFSLPSNGCVTREFPVIKRVEIPKSFWTTPAGFNYITVDRYKGTCNDVFVYITNAFDSSVVVFDYKRNIFSYVNDTSMKPIMSESNLVFNDGSSEPFSYTLPLGIANLALGRPDKYGNRNAYYFPGSSQGEYAVSTKLLKNFKRNPLKHTYTDFKYLGYRGCKTQAYKQVFDEETGVIFFGEIQSGRISCWNTQKPINPDNIGVVYESDELQFVSEIFIDKTGYLWFHSSQVPIDFLTTMPLDTANVNSRTFRIKVSEAIEGTICEIPDDTSRKIFMTDEDYV